MKYNPKIVLAYFAECGLPKPELEYKFHPDRKWRFDFCFRQNPDDSRYWLALEVEGAIWMNPSKQSMGSHVRPKHFVKDMEKYNEAAALGYRLIRVEPKDLCTQDTVNLIKRTLGI